MEELKKIAMLIDADNTSLKNVSLIIQEVSAYGRILAKKAYGNWKSELLKNWESEIKKLGIIAEQQFAYVSGKNATDIAMVIDAMEMLYSDRYDTFVLVSSDSDFTPLALHLKAAGMYVFGAGEHKTPDSFRSACDEFIRLEYLSAPKPSHDSSPDEGAETSKPLFSDETMEPEEDSVEEIHELLRKANEKYQDADGFVNLSPAGSYVKRAKPDFNAKTYGYSKLPELLEAFPELYEIKRYKGKGTVTIIAYRCL